MAIKEQEKKLNTILRRREVSKKLRNEEDQDKQENQITEEYII